MRVRFSGWRLLPPVVILAALAGLVLGIFVVRPYFLGPCSGSATPTDNYICYQQHYQDLVLNSGVEVAFVDLKDRYKADEFVRSNCHQLTHVIGRSAADLYGDTASTYQQGDEFCAAGYYHGATEELVDKLGADKILTDADNLCAQFREGQDHSYDQRNCAHGLGHGFMEAMDNELFDSLQACDSLGDEWEQKHCYSGVFMQNTMVEVDPSLPSTYLKADEPLYPCTDVQPRYKDQCYKRQAPYAVDTQGDFAKVFDLCAKVADGFQPSCYQGMGWAAAGEGITGEGITHSDENEPTKEKCMIGEDYEAQSNCVIGAVRSYIVYYHNGPQPKEMCEAFEADLRNVCLEAADEYYKDFQE